MLARILKQLLRFDDVSAAETDFVRSFVLFSLSKYLYDFLSLSLFWSLSLVSYVLPAFLRRAIDVVDNTRKIYVDHTKGKPLSRALC